MLDYVNVQEPFFSLTLRGIYGQFILKGFVSIKHK